MGKKQDLIGKRFGKWVVVENLPSKHGVTSGGFKKVERVSLCVCDCGTKKQVLSRSLLRGQSVSCGCGRKEACRNLHILPKGEASLNRVLDAYKSNAAKRKIPFNLSKDFIKSIIKEDCFYCGTPPNNHQKNSCGNGDLIYSGLDRKDNNIGYEENNVVPCCSMCNTAKRHHSLEDFKAWVIKAYEKILTNAY